MKRGTSARDSFIYFFNYAPLGQVQIIRSGGFYSCPAKNKTRKNKEKESSHNGKRYFHFLPRKEKETMILLIWRR